MYGVGSYSPRGPIQHPPHSLYADLALYPGRHGRNSKCAVKYPVRHSKMMDKISDLQAEWQRNAPMDYANALFFSSIHTTLRQLQRAQKRLAYIVWDNPTLNNEQ